MRNKLLHSFLSHTTQYCVSSCQVSPRMEEEGLDHSQGIGTSLPLLEALEQQDVCMGGGDFLQAFDNHSEKCIDKCSYKMHESSA